MIYIVTYLSQNVRKVFIYFIFILLGLWVARGNNQMQFSLFSSPTACYVQNECCRLTTVPLLLTDFILPCRSVFSAAQGLTRPPTVTLWRGMLGDLSAWILVSLCSTPAYSLTPTFQALGVDLSVTGKLRSPALINAPVLTLCSNSSSLVSDLTCVQTGSLACHLGPVSLPRVSVCLGLWILAPWLKLSL